MSHRISLLIGLTLSLAVPAPAGAAATGTDARADFLKLIDRPRVPLAPAVAEAPAAGGLREAAFSYMSEVGERVPGILVEAAGGTGRRPAVVALHGTGASKESELPFLRELARAGFVAVAIDARFHGSRTPSGPGSAAYVAAILRTYRSGLGHPFFFDTVWDVLRLLDYLDTRSDVDPKRIGLFGVSMGGIETYLAAAVDPRVAVAVPCLGLESFRWAVDHDSWRSRIGTVQAAFDAAARDAGIAQPGAEFVHAFYARVAPGLDGEFDGPTMALLIAPRPLLAINGDSDARTPLPGLNECVDAARSAYAAAGAADRFGIYLEPHTAHQVTPEGMRRAQAWLVRWLRP
jgi:dienelactone hydrolase